MTEPKRARRSRRRTGPENLPRDLAEWFAGEVDGRPPWSALIYPDCDLLHSRWQDWKSSHPKAAPPAGYEWLDKPPPQNRHGMPWEDAVAAARKCASRRKR